MRKEEDGGRRKEEMKIVFLHDQLLSAHVPHARRQTLESIRFEQLRTLAPAAAPAAPPATASAAAPALHCDAELDHKVRDHLRMGRATNMKPTDDARSLRTYRATDDTWVENNTVR